jgi:hypothetical protein
MATEYGGSWLAMVEQSDFESKKSNVSREKKLVDEPAGCQRFFPMCFGKALYKLVSQRDANNISAHE